MLKKFLFSFVLFSWGALHANTEMNYQNSDELPKKPKLNITIKDPVNSQNGVDIDKQIKISEDFFKIGNHFLAIKILEDLKNKTNPQDQQEKLNKADFLLAGFYHRIGLLDTAKKLYQELLEKNNNQVIKNLSALLQKQNTQKSLQELDDISQKYSHSPYVFENIGRSNIKMKNFPVALTNYVRAYTIDRNNLAYLYNIGVLLEKMKRYDTAAVVYQKTLNRVNNAKTEGIIYPEIDEFRLIDKISMIKNILQG